MQPEKESGIEVRFVRKALKDWHSLHELAKNPLSRLSVVENRRQAAGYTANPTGYGLALREVLENIIRSLKPEDPSVQEPDKRWRPYIILNMQFIEGRSPNFIQQQLHIARGTYFSEQTHAIALISDCLSRMAEQTGEHPENIPQPDKAPQAPFLSPSYPTYPFIGRDTLLASLKNDLLQGQENNGAYSASQIALLGLPGAGKTRIALEIAYDPDIRAHYSDGILWAGLGQKPDIPALLGAWAAALHIPDEELGRHSDLNERVRLLHAAISNRKMLLVIDDAWQSESALVFKLGGPDCAYLLTTRLIDVAVDFAGNNVTHVREMGLHDGMDLLRYFLPGLCLDGSQDIAALVQSVGGLPLALILIGRYLQKYRYKTQERRLKEAILDLKEAQQRLQMSQPVSPLEANPGIPPGTPLSLQAAIGLSDSALDQKAHMALTALSVFPPKPNSFSEEAALAVSGAGAAVLDALVDIGLVECMSPDRYTLHQTIYDYARMQTGYDSVEHRMVDYYVTFAVKHGADFDSLMLELANLLAAFEIADHKSQNDSILHLTNALYDFLETHGLYEICQRVVERALQSACILEDERKMAEIIFRLGDLELRQGNIPSARRHLEDSVRLSRSIQDRYLETKASFQLGDANMFGGGWKEAQEIFMSALMLARAQGFQDQEGWVLSALGYACMESCQFQSGIEYLEEALKLCRLTGNRRVEGWSYFNLSLIYLPLGYFSQAQRYADLCRICYHELGDQRGESWLVYHYGRLARKKGQCATARNYFEAASRSFYDLGDRMGLGFSIHNLGLVDAESGSWQTAREQYVEAMDIFKKTRCLLGESQCLQSMGELHRWTGNQKEALIMLHEALEMRRKFPYPRGMARAQANLAMVYLSRAEYAAAQQFAQDAVEQARHIDARSTLAYALTCQGKVYLTVGQYVPALAALNEALRLRRILGQQHLLWEPLAHLAQTHLLLKDEIHAADCIRETRCLLDLAPCTAGVHHPAAVQ